MSKSKAILIDVVICALILLMMYGFYLGAPQIYRALIGIFTLYGFTHFAVDSYGYISAPTEAPKHEKPTTREGRPLRAWERLASRFGFPIDEDEDLDAIIEEVHNEDS